MTHRKTYNKSPRRINHKATKSKTNTGTTALERPVVEPRRAKPKTYRQAPTHWLKFYEEAVIESVARTAIKE